MDARISLSNQPQRSTLHSWGYYTEIQGVFKRFEVAEVMPSPADVKSAFNARHRSDDVQVEPTSDKADTSNDFYKAFDEFVRVCGGRTTGRTLPMRSLLR